MHYSHLGPYSGLVLGPYILFGSVTLHITCYLLTFITYAFCCDFFLTCIVIQNTDDPGLIIKLIIHRSYVLLIML